MAGKHDAPRRPLSTRAKGAWGSAVIAVTAGLYSLIAASPLPHSALRPHPSNPQTTGSIPRIRASVLPLPSKTSVFVKASPSGSSPPVRAVAPSPAPSRSVRPAPNPVQSVVGGLTLTAKQAAVVTFLRAQLGKPYSYGGNGPNSYDCSGLVVAAFKVVGVHLPRTTQEQGSVGAPVSLHNLQPGDILFWGSPAFHSAVYVGGGEFIAAENPALGVVIRPLTWDYPSYARRVL